MDIAERTDATTRPLKRHVAAVVAGNALEFYDFLTYAIFAVYIGRAFFPNANPASSLLLSLATFGAGFITRPIGGVVIGSLGDRIGRRWAMFFSFSLMGVALLGMALTPSYANIGIAAPILVLCFRLVQGFALGGEVGPTTAFLIEAPPAGSRGFYGSLQSASQYIAVIAAGAASTGLAAILDPATLETWGWRIAFLLGAAIVPFGLIVRRSLPETMHIRDAAADGSAAHLLRRHIRIIVCGLAMLACATVATYVILFLTTYALSTLRLAPAWSFAATLVIGICGMGSAAMGGLLSDRVGRKPVMIVSLLATMLVTIPAFLLLVHVRSGPVLLAVAAVLATAFVTGGAVTIMTVAESLPPRIRSGATATIYALSIAIFGGTTQVTIQWLTNWTGDAIASAYYMTAALVVGLAATALIAESAPLRRKSA